MKRRLGAGWLLAIVVLASSGFARAQGPDKIGSGALEDAERTHSRLATKLLKGETRVDPRDESHNAALDWLAQWSTYRFYYSSYQKSDPTGRLRESISRVYIDFENALDNISRYNKDAQTRKEVSKLFAEKLVVRGKEVLVSKYPIARINAARVLAKAADLGQPVLALPLAEVIGDKAQLDAVKYYAAKGLAKTLSQVKKPNPPELTKEQLAQIAKILDTFLNQKRDYPPSTSTEEVDGYRVLRREVIAALGETTLPALPVPDTTRPAWTLMRYMSFSKDVVPTPRIDEAVQAAIGLGKMNPKLDKDYNADYAAQRMAVFIDQFLTFVNNQNRQFKYPVRKLSSDMIVSLETLKTNTNEMKDEAKQFIGKVVAEASRQLIMVEQRRGTPNGQNLAVLAREATGTAEQLFANVPESTVSPPKPPTP